MADNVNKNKVRGSLLKYRANKQHEELLGSKGKKLSAKEAKALGLSVDSNQWWESEKN